MTSADKRQTETIAPFLAGLEIGEPVLWESLAMFPLSGGKNRVLDYLLMGEALDQGLLTITEVTESGHVSELKALNRAGRRVLLLDGEELRGAKQNRSLNLSVLLGVQTETVIPVSCVEAGRWAYRARAFSAADHVFFAAARAAKARSVSENLRFRRQARSDQAEVWSMIGEKMCSMRMESPTQAVADLFEGRRDSLDAFVQAMQSRAGQRGALFVLNGRVVSLDLFDAPQTLEKLLPKLVRSHALDAIAAPRRDGMAADAVRTVHQFLETLRRAPFVEYPAVGEGRHLRLEGKGLAGGALVADGVLVHLCAFRVHDAGADRRSEWEHLIYD